MPIPVHCVTGLEPVAMESVTVGVQWDLPRAVVVRHTIDLEAKRLHRVVSDATGVLERESVDIEHLCTTCALQEDILPTLDRLAAIGRWDSIVAHLPVGMEAAQLCRMLDADDDRADSLRVAGVMLACEAGSLPGLLVTDDLLVERALHSSDTDRRGVAEVMARLVEYADVCAVFGPMAVSAAALLRTLARPGALVVEGWPGLQRDDLIAGLHHPATSESWVADVFTAPIGEADGEHVWRLDLLTTDPLDPARFLDRLEDLGAGPHRTRGFLWLPTRPDDVVAWQGAGGQVSVGVSEHWAGRPRHSRIVVVGLHECGDDRERIRDAFLGSLVTEADRRDRGLTWAVAEDGLEPWLGPVAGEAA
jgi:G3E family GTPase